MADESSSAIPPKPTGSSYLFNGDAQAILEAAPDLDTGLGLLTQAYNARSWDEPDKAKEEMADYAQKLRYRFKDDAIYSADDTVHHAPIDIAHFTGKGDTDSEKNIDRINQWEQANKDYLTNTSTADYLIDRDKQLRSIDKTASALRRQSDGKTDSWLTDKFYRASLGMTGGILKALKADETVKSLQEKTNPDTDQNISSGLASGAGFLGGVALSAIGGPYTEIPYLAATGAGEARQAYRDTLENTGDTSMATKAGAIEAGSQVIQTALGAKLIGGKMTALGNIFTEGLAGAANRVAAKTAEASVIGVAGQALTNTAKQYESYRPTTSVYDDLGRAALINGIFGATTGSIREGAVAAGKKAVGNIDTQSVNDNLHDLFPEQMGQGLEVPEPPPVHTDEAPINTKQTDASKGEPAVEDIAAPAEPPQSPTHDFLTSDGSGYRLSDNGETAARTDPAGVVNHPLDRTYYVTTDEAKKIVSLKNTPNADGTLPQVTVAGGKLFVRNITDHPLNDGSIPLGGRKKDTYEPQVSLAPAIGLHPVEVNGARTANGVAAEYRARVGNDITQLGGEISEEAPPAEASTVPEQEQAAQNLASEGPATSAPDSTGGSAGAAYAGELKTTETRRRILDSPQVSNKIKDELLENGTQYFVIPNARNASEGDRYIANHGISGATEAVLNRGENEVSPLLEHVSFSLFKHYNEAAKRAELAGDFETAGKLASRAVDIHEHFEQMGNVSGRVLRYRQELYKDPDLYLMGLRQKAKDRALQEVALSEGITAKDLREKIAKAPEVEQQQKVIEDQANALKKLAEQNAKPESEAAKKIKEKEPEEFLPADTKARLKDLKETAAEITRLKKKSDSSVEQALSKNEKNTEQLKQILDNLSKAVSPSAKERLAKKAFEVEQKTLQESKGDGYGFFHKYWLANKVSGLGTVEKKGFFDLLNGYVFTPASFLFSKYPGAAGEFIKGFTRAAIGVGKDTAIETFRTGKEPGGVWAVDPDKPFQFSEANVRKLFPGQDLLNNPPDWSKIKLGSRDINLQKAANALSSVGWVFRYLGGLNAGYYKSMQEGAANALAYIEAKKSGLSGEALRSAIGEKLFNSTSDWEKAMQSAEKDAEVLKNSGIEVSPRETRLRASELIEQQRAPEFADQVEKFVQSVSLTKAPTGFVGQAIEGLGKVGNANLHLFGKDIKPLKYALPFMRVMGNLINLGADYIPGTRLISGELHDKSLGELERTTMIGRQLTGAMLTASVFGMAYAFKDDKDPAFWLYGEGPTDQKLKETFRQSGALPWSVKVGGNYFSYAHSPLVLLFGGLGTLLDRVRYDPKFDPKDIGDAAVITMAGGFNAFIHQSFLKQLGTLADAVQGEKPVDQVKDALGAEVVSIGKGFIPFEGTLRTITKAFEDPTSTYHSIQAKILEGVPVAQEANNKWLNVFGEPIYKPISQRIGTFYSSKTSDPQFNWMADNGYGLTIPLHVEIPGIKGTEIESSRAAALGAKFANVLTQDEREELVKTAGPRLRDLVKSYQQEYGNSAHSDEVQKALTKDAGKILTTVKQELFIK